MTAEIQELIAMYLQPNSDIRATEMNEICTKIATEIDSKLVGTEFLGSRNAVDTPTGTGAAFWVATQSGTYTNFGGVVVSANSFAVISRDALGAFSISQTAFDITSKVNVSDVINTLVSTETAKPLSASQGKVLKDLVDTKVNTIVTDNLSSTISTNALSANQGKVLNGKILVNIDSLTKKADLTVGKNLFDKSKALLGYYLTGGGGLVASPSYDVSDFIPVTVGQQYKGSGIGFRFTTYFNSSKILVAGGSETTVTTFTVPAGVDFVRITMQHTSLDVFQIETGSVSTSYESYKLVLRSDQISISDNLITTEKIQDGAVNELKTSFFVASKNLVNPYATNIVNNYFINSGGGLQGNSDYIVSEYIPALEGAQFVKNNLYGGAIYSAFYNSSFVYIASSASNSKSVTAPVNSAYLRVSVARSFFTTYQLELGTISTSYLPFGAILKEKYITPYLAPTDLSKLEYILGKEGKIVSQASLTTGNIIEITDFPYYLIKGVSMSFYADLTLTGSVTYGKGYNAFNSAYFKIDNTNIYYYRNNVLLTTTAHGLTISTFLKSSFYLDDNSIAYVVLQSLNGTFQTTFTLTHEINFKPFIRTDGQTITNIKLTVTSKEFRHPVWAFGDSYFGVTSARWVGVMKQFGFFNILLNALSGLDSTGAREDLDRCLIYGRPKYILWCLGMNDSDLAYNNGVEYVKSKCTELGITLILATIPTVPTRSKEVIRTSVLASGYRYVDFYKSVGADSSGNWYANYLDVDGVHPKVLGAQALATQVLVDFPEIMQYGKIL